MAKLVFSRTHDEQRTVCGTCRWSIHQTSIPLDQIQCIPLTQAGTQHPTSLHQDCTVLLCR